MLHKLFKKLPRAMTASPLKTGSHKQAHYPDAAELSLYDIAILMQNSIDALKRHKIGRVRFEKLLIADSTLILQISYFRALDKLPAESAKRGMAETGRSYTQFQLPVRAGLVIAWIKEGV